MAQPPAHHKPMTYQIDQSGKIEQTNIKTVLAITNDTYFTVALSALDKRLLEQIFKQLKRPKLFPFLVFSALLAILIKKVQPKNKVVIDHEYSGRESLILERSIYYLTLLRQKPSPHLEFGHVGKLSKSHQLAHDVATGKKKNSYQASLKEIMRLIFHTKKIGNPEGSRSD